MNDDIKNYQLVKLLGEKKNCGLISEYYQS